MLIPTLPHSLSQLRQYIETYTLRRSRDPDRPDHVLDIDDIRNGLFLHTILNHTLGKEVAFLVVRVICMILDGRLTADVSRPPTLP